MNAILTAESMSLLLNGMWQSVVLVLVIAVVVHWLRLSVAVRYTMWYVALVSLVLVPLATLGYQALGSSDSGASMYLVEEFSEQTHVIPQPSGTDGSTERVYHKQVQTEEVIWHGEPSEEPQRVAPVALTEGAWIMVLGGVWALGAWVMGGRLLWSVRHTARLQRTAQPLSTFDADRFARLLKRYKQSRVEIRTSAMIRVPQVVGVWRPVVLLPEALLDHLDDAEWEQVLLHEVAHIERHDQWTLLGQRLIEVGLWFNPVVWWIGHHLALERELACDDWAVQASGQTKRYAWCLTKLVEWGLAPRTSSLVSSMLFRKNTLENRIEHILGGHSRLSARWQKLHATFAIALVVGVSVFVVQTPPVFAIVQGMPSTSLVDIDIPDTPAGRLLHHMLQEDGLQHLYKLDVASSEALVAYAVHMKTGARMEWHVEVGQDAEGGMQYQNVNVVAVADQVQP